jgi:hypothetical protein
MSRRKRNVIDYDYAFVATDTEAKEILTERRGSTHLRTMDKFGESFPCEGFLLEQGTSDKP